MSRSGGSHLAVVLKRLSGVGGRLPGVKAQLKRFSETGALRLYLPPPQSIPNSQLPALSLAGGLGIQPCDTMFLQSPACRERVGKSAIG